MNEMKHPVMRPSKPEHLEFMIRIADKIPVREEQQFNNVPMEVAGSPGTGPPFIGPRIRGRKRAGKIYVSHIDVSWFQCYKTVSRDETLGRDVRGDVKGPEKVRSAG